MFPIGGTILGVWMLTVGMRTYQIGRAASDWPTTRGKITSSAVTEDHDRDKAYYIASVTYTYSVDSVTYTGDTIYAGYGGSSSQAVAQNLADDYPVGETVNILYDPQTPEISVLSEGMALSNYLTIGAGFVVLIWGLALLRHLPAEWRA